MFKKRQAIECMAVSKYTGKELICWHTLVTCLYCDTEFKKESKNNHIKSETHCNNVMIFEAEQEAEAEEAHKLDVIMFGDHSSPKQIKKTLLNEKANRLTFAVFQK
jgi:hypothetical protein